MHEYGMHDKLSEFGCVRNTDIFSWYSKDLKESLLYQFCQKEIGIRSSVSGTKNLRYYELYQGLPGYQRPGEQSLQDEH